MDRRALRRKLGPPSDDGGRPSPRSPERRPSRRLVAGATAVVTVAAAAAVALAATPRDHAAPGCLWWTARTVSEVTPGQSGCARGVFTFGGALGEGAGPGDPSLPLAVADPTDPTGSRSRAACPFRPGDAVVVRYHAMFDDGRTIIVVDDCR